MSSQELAWAAGFIDGEGSIGVCRERDRRKSDSYFIYRPALQVSNTQPVTLERLADIFGVGQVIAVSSRNKRHAPQFHYHLRNRQLLEPLEALTPHLFLKIEQAVLTLQFIRSRIISKAFGRGWHAPYTSAELFLYERLAQINKRGPDLRVVA